jgi:hypothetical protein
MTGAEVGQRSQWIHGSGVGGARRADDEEGVEAPFPVGLDPGPQSLG